jgi:hypothetical protein
VGRKASGGLVLVLVSRSYLAWWGRLARTAVQHRGSGSHRLVADLLHVLTSALVAGQGEQPQHANEDHKNRRRDGHCDPAQGGPDAVQHRQHPVHHTRAAPRCLASPCGGAARAGITLMTEASLRDLADSTALLLAQEGRHHSRPALAVLLVVLLTYAQR